MPKRKGYETFINSLANKWKVNPNTIRNDNTYDYESYYNDNSKSINYNNLGETHFTDKYKTANHPTFSNESKYSGYKNKHNPKGITGGTWGNDRKTDKPVYRLSNSQLKNNWDVNDTFDYLNYAEDYGVVPLTPNNHLFKMKDGLYGGVLPNVKVKPNNKK